MNIRKPNNEFLILLSIIGIAVVARVFVIWIGRPEFVGWFSHTYYYFVEVRGLLESGSLVYPDMPLLFYVYAGISRLLILFGIESGTAIVASTRMVMCFAPALIALPVYSFSKSINGGKKLTKINWLLVSCSVFLPLSLTHLTEILQKNMFGLVLFVFLQVVIYRLLRAFSLTKLLTVFLLTIAIFLTHIGTFGAVLFFYAALFAAYSLTSGTLKRVLIGLLSIGFTVGVSVFLTFLIDPARFERIIYYIGRSLSNSLVGLAFLGETFAEKAQYAGATVLTFLLTFLLYRFYRLKRENLERHDKVFWLTNMFFVYLLVFPVLDVDIVVRFLVFVPLQLIFLLIYLNKHVGRKWFSYTLAGALGIACATIAFGEIVGAQMRNSENQKVHREINSIRERKIFAHDDFVVSKYSVNPMCNWFFETRAGLITSFNKYDFRKYRKIYILNPKQEELTPEALDKLTGKEVRNEADKYDVMRNNIIIPKSVRPVLETESIEIFELDSPPSNWKFDSNGNWIGYLKD